MLFSACNCLPTSSGVSRRDLAGLWRRAPEENGWQRIGPSRQGGLLDAQVLTGRGHRPFAEIKVAQLGEDAGIVGAADLARQRTAERR